MSRALTWGRGKKHTQKSAATWRMEVVLSSYTILQPNHIGLTLPSSPKLGCSSRGKGMDMDGGWYGIKGLLVAGQAVSLTKLLS